MKRGILQSLREQRNSWQYHTFFKSYENEKDNYESCECQQTLVLWWMIYYVIKKRLVKSDIVVGLLFWSSWHLLVSVSSQEHHQSRKRRKQCNLLQKLSISRIHKRLRDTNEKCRIVVETILKKTEIYNENEWNWTTKNDEKIVWQVERINEKWCRNYEKYVLCKRDIWIRSFRFVKTLHYENPSLQTTSYIQLCQVLILLL